MSLAYIMTRKTCRLILPEPLNSVVTNVRNRHQRQAIRLIRHTDCERA